MTTSIWGKFCLLMWKNWLLQIRHKLQTVFEILIPVAFSGLLVMIRSLVEPTVYENDFIYEALQVDNFTSNEPGIPDIPDLSVFQKAFSSSNYSRQLFAPNIGYAPANEVLTEVMAAVARATGFTLTVLSDGTALQQHLIAANSFAGIEFPSNYQGITELPARLNYSIRFPAELRMFGNNGNPINFNWRTDMRFPMFLAGVRNRNSNHGGFPSGYYAERFIHLQHIMFTAYLEVRQLLNSVPDVFLRRYPYPAHTRDTLLLGLESVIALIILLSFIYPTINMVKFVTTEKEKQLKEAMKIMGLDNWLHWTAWFIKFILFLTLSITLMTILLCVSWYQNTDVAVFTFSNPLTIWLFLFIFSISTIMFCFMMSVFFSKANTAAAVTGLICFVTFAPFSFLSQNFNNISLPVLLASCILSNSAMGFGFLVIVRHEGNGNGLQWSNFFQPPSIDEQLTVGYVVLMLLFNSVLYLLITLYVEMVFPGDYGVAEPWYFPFTQKFWCNRVQYINAEDVFQSNPNSNAMEIDPVEKTAGIQIKGLRKIYSNKKVAVQGLTLNMFEDQITVLLGHNGAGKTTTMSMLTGMISPTSGTALISGKDVRNDIKRVRGSLGLCPQHNILFDELTVREHIEFYGRLKGLPKNKINAEVLKYVTLLNLQNKTNMQSHTLSGGMQRKLSVAVALCADSKVVLCDEPTSGMDPSARRSLWDLLLHEKKGRTILLSTHFMDEADILGDRIAIMAAGTLKAVGSSFFLKKKFGVGYRLICVKESGCSPDNVTTLLQKHIPEVEIKTNIGSELSYELPESRVTHFQSMLEDLEAHSEELQLLNYGISLTTLEEVFLKVGSDCQPAVVEVEEPNKIFYGENKSDSTTTLYNMNTVPQLTGFVLFLNQIYALFLKQILFSLRNWILSFLQNLIPIVFLIITVLIVRAWGGNTDLPAFHLILDQYSPTRTLMQRDLSLGPLDTETSIVYNYQSLFDNQSNTLVDTSGKSLITRVLQLSRKMQTRVDTQYMIGVSIMRNNVTAWFNNQPFHTAPIAINMVHNALLRTFCDSPTCGLEVTNKPLPFDPDTRFGMLQAGNNLGFQLAFNLGFGLAFVSAFYVIAYVKERSSKAKLLQFVSGVNAAVYWTTALIWDYFTFIVTSLLIVLTLLIFQEDDWSTFNELGRTFLVLLAFGVAFLPMIYLSSLLFSVPATGFIRMSIFFIFTGTGMFTIVFTLRFEEFDLLDEAEIMTNLFLVFPHFALSDAFSNLNIVNTVRSVCQQVCDNNIFCNNMEDLCILPDLSRCCTDTDYFMFGAPGITRHLTYMFGIGIISFIFLLIVEFRMFHYIFYNIRSLFKQPIIPLSEDRTIDSDVTFERNRVNNMQVTEIKNYNLVVRDMTKYYKKFLAVNQLTLGVDKYECFGLLGINGAGKTTTFKMLIGDETFSGGDAWVQGISLKKNMKEVHKQIGYCPQFDALIDDMTGRETLRFFCFLRGVPRKHISDVSNALATELNFTKHIDKQVKEYSGGNKRKLSTAVALIGNPSMVYLDEPTTGMDPGAKRHLWSVICKVRNQGRSIVLTSHSMEECEALCTRLAIMVNGEFKCLGSVQHLKSKFSKGFLLTVKANIREEVYDLSAPNQTSHDDRLFKIKDHIAGQFPKAVLKEEFQGLLTYHIPSIDLKWSQIFGIMELAKLSLDIEDYSIGQTSLEQVFLSFAKNQKV